MNNMDFKGPHGVYFPYYEEEFKELRFQGLVDDFVRGEDNTYYVKKKVDSQALGPYVIVHNYHDPCKITEYYTGKEFTYDKKKAKLYSHLNIEKANNICKRLNRGDISIEEAEEVLCDA